MCNNIFFFLWFFFSSIVEHRIDFIHLTLLYLHYTYSYWNTRSNYNGEVKKEEKKQKPIDVHKENRNVEKKINKIYKCLQYSVILAWYEYVILKTIRNYERNPHRIANNDNGYSLFSTHKQSFTVLYLYIATAYGRWLNAMKSNPILMRALLVWYRSKIFIFVANRTHLRLKIVSHHLLNTDQMRWYRRWFCCCCYKWPAFAKDWPSNI